MGPYTTPKLKTMSFAAEEAISATASRSESADLGSNLFNDAEFGGW